MSFSINDILESFRNTDYKKGILPLNAHSAMKSRQQWAVFCCLGLAVSMVLHGTYNWLCDIQPGYAALMVGISFVLFYSYLPKLRKQIE